MKKLSLLLVVVLAFSSLFLFGCGNNEKIIVDEQGNIYANYGFTDSEKETLIYGFDELKDFQEINATVAFGITRPNTDKRYVLQGEGSMEVRVDGYGKMLHFPESVDDRKQCIFIYPRMFFKDTNFLNASSFRIDVYNDNDTAQQIGLSIIGKTNRLIFEPQILPPRQWTTCDFKINTKQAYYQGLGDVSEMHIVFENRQYGQEPAHFYLDNFRYVKEGTYSARLEVPIFNGTTICDFENEYFYLTAVNVWQSAPQGTIYDKPKVEWNDDKNYVKSGEKSLKITRFPSNQQLFALGGYFDIVVVDSNYLQTVDFTKYDAEKTVIKLDVYLDFSGIIDLSVSLASASVASNENLVLTPGWNEITYSMNRSDLDWSLVSYFNFIMPEFYGSENAVLYVDNIRIVSADA